MCTRRLRPVDGQNQILLLRSCWICPTGPYPQHEALVPNSNPLSRYCRASRHAIDPNHGPNYLGGCILASFLLASQSQSSCFQFLFPWHIDHHEI